MCLAFLQANPAKADIFGLVSPAGLEPATP
jgi:hypothetical protein